MRRARTVVVSIATSSIVVAGAASCSLVSDFDGIAGVRPPDADTDVGELDAGAGDATTDASFACGDGKSLLCSTFDEGAVDKGGWKIETLGSGTVTLDATQFTSPPASFHSRVGTTSAGTKVSAILNQKVTTGPFTTLFYAFDMRVLACASEGNAGSVTVAAIQPSTQTAFGLVLIDTNVFTIGQLRLSDGQFKSSPLSVQPSKDWQRVVMRVSIDATAAHVTVTVGGATAFDGDVDPGRPSNDVILNLGANATGPIKGCDVVYDNVAYGKE